VIMVDPEARLLCDVKHRGAEWTRRFSELPHVSMT
jgi:hypothetical protein